MINFWVALRNPFRCRDFRMLYLFEKRLTTNKTFEFQISRYAFNLLELQVDLNWRQIDHAGPWIMINIFGYQFDIRIYDHRHWDKQNNTWNNQ